MQEIVRYFEKAKEAREGVLNAKTGRDLRDSWEEFLHNYNRSLGKLIHLAKSRTETRGLGHRIKNASQKDDEGLVFLREARNQDEHGLEPSAEYEDGVTNLFGAIALGPNCRDIKLSNCKVNGQETGTLVVDTDETGRISRLQATDPVLASFRPASITLKEIVSGEKRSTFPVPKSLNGQLLSRADPAELAKFALQFLESSIAEYRRMTSAL